MWTLPIPKDEAPVQPSTPGTMGSLRARPQGFAKGLCIKRPVEARLFPLVFNDFQLFSLVFQ